MTARSWILRNLAGAVALAALAGGGRAQAPNTPAKPAAVVNGEPISLAEVDALLKQTPTPTEPTAVQRKQMQLEAVGMLIDDLLLQQFIRTTAPRIDPAAVDKRLAEEAANLKQKGKTLDDFLKETGQTEAQLRTEVLNMLRWQEYMTQTVKDAEVKRFYDQTKDYFDNITVRASHIVLRVPQSSDAAKMTADREAARAKLQALRQEIVAGKLDFAEAAKKNSQCSTAPNGGDLGFFPRKGMMDENLARAAFALKVGELSDVVQSDIGMHLIKVTDRKANGPPSEFEKIKDKVRWCYVQELQVKILEEQRQKAQIQVNLP